MLNNLFKHKIIWLTIGLLTLYAACSGVADFHIYDRVVTPSLIPGAFGQDLMSLFAAVVLSILGLTLKEKHIKGQIVALGILGYLFYAYGIYVVEQVYNMLYLVYMAIFALSFWGMVYGAGSIKKEIGERISLSSPVRVFSILAALLQPIVFYPLWIFALLPLMREGNRIESLFSVYILDLCFIMPGFLVLTWLLLKKNIYGYLLTPAIFILGFAIIFSLAVSELAKLKFGIPPSNSALLQSGALSALFLFALALHLYKLKIEDRAV